jgi:predicted nucleotidyltransferase
MTNSESNIAQMISERIRSQDPNAEVILFGSRARGDSGVDSDWDVLILIDQNKRSRSIEKKYRDEMFALELELGQSISTFVYSKKDWNTKFSVTPLFRNIKKEGIKLT